MAYRPPHKVLAALAYATAHNLQLGGETARILFHSRLSEPVEFLLKLFWLVSILVLASHIIPRLLEANERFSRAALNQIDRGADIVDAAISKVRNGCIFIVERVLIWLKSQD